MAYYIGVHVLLYNAAKQMFTTLNRTPLPSYNAGFGGGGALNRVIKQQRYNQ
jgi:hypothetical protein